jgi:hypothetical protein
MQTTGNCLLCDQACQGQHALRIKAAVDIANGRGVRVTLSREAHVRYLAALLLCFQRQGFDTTRLLAALQQPHWGGLRRPVYHDVVKTLAAPDDILNQAADQLIKLITEENML